MKITINKPKLPAIVVNDKGEKEKLLDKNFYSNNSSRACFQNLESYLAILVWCIPKNLPENP